MQAKTFAKFLKRLEDTPKRLEITAILKELLADLSAEEVTNGVYLSLGLLQAPYENPKFNIAEKMMLRVLANAYPTAKEDIEKLYSKIGDLGDVAYELAPDNAKKGTITITELHAELTQLAAIAGAGSQEDKVAKLTKILEKLDKLSAKFVVRIVLGTTRLGFTELTVIDALNNLIEGTKETEAEIEMRYNMHPDIGFIAKQLKLHGIKGIEEVQMEVGIPVWPQRCQRLSDTNEIIEKMGLVQAEFKLDGTRVQLHMDRNKRITSTETNQESLFGSSADQIFVKTYTRNLEDTTHQYPDINKAALDQLDADSVILDGEAVGYNKDTGTFLPFQEIMQRKRKHGIADMAFDIPLRYFVFDILYLNGKALVNETLEERRKILAKIIKPGKILEVNSKIITKDPKELTEFFEESRERGLEGIVVKKVDALYQAGARSYSWVKLKRSDTKLLEDTFDCVILGYSFGKGTRAEFGIGQFLSGIYDKATDTFKTFTKVGTGLKEEDFVFLKKELDRIKVAKQPANVEVSKKFIPDVWVSPKIVVELGGDEISKSAEHSSGYALRFPRLLKFRTDKKAIDCTSLEEILDIYGRQKRGNY